ncbi:MAG: TrkH family potassium uptake protein [Alphaproteobacteria bacterium]|nr:TrkH family potassium uptake protein [Alphaproteobacteria bacterium]
MKYQIIGFTLGMILVIIGIACIVPALLDWGDPKGNTDAFIRCAIASAFFGGILIISNSGFSRDINIKQGFLITTLSWFFLGLFTSFPFYMSNINISFTDAFFESVSGITTTGSTVLHGLDDMSKGVLLWRSMIQWIGGIGIIGFAIVFLPFLRIGGMQLFRTESSDKSEKIMPRAKQIASSVFVVYLLLTSIFCLTYRVLGMSWFDAVNHAMTTISTAGYSTHDASFGYFNSYALDMAGSLFMLMSGLPFLLYVKLVYQGKFPFFSDDQFKAFIAITLGLTLIMTIWLWAHSEYSLANSFRYTIFHVSSVITTTGFATTDYLTWGPFSITFFLFISYLGGCAGSTGGGLKIMRIIIALKASDKHIKRLIHPHGVFTVRYQGTPLQNDVIKDVFGFLGLYVLANAFFTLILAWMGLDFETAISAAATAISNTGPGIGNVIGPAGNFAPLPDAAKWILCFCMILGRLEIITVFVLFRPEYWKD